LKERKIFMQDFSFKPLKLPRGFTLLELLIVVGILAALVALALPYYQDYLTQSRLTAAQSDLKTFAKALASYDQLEPNMFNSVDNLTPLIGKYLHDFRTFTGQLIPRDPWGRDYVVRPTDGTVISGGPNGTIDTPSGNRLPSGDDLLIAWKPPFFISDARTAGTNYVDVTFSRKIQSGPTQANITFVGGTPTAQGDGLRLSDTIFRIPVSGSAAGRTIRITNSTVTAQDGKNSFDTNPSGSPGNEYAIP